MNSKIIHPAIVSLTLLLAIAGSARAQNAAFTYQGQLNLNSAPANGFYDISFSLYATNSGGGPLDTPVTNLDVPVSNGLFTTTLQFSNNFFGANYWLDISVRTNSGGAFNELSPRQLLAPVPLAIFANSANFANFANSASNVLGQVAAAQISGALPISAGGSGQTNPAAALAALGGASLNGNNTFNGANTFSTTVTFTQPVSLSSGSSQNGVMTFPPYLMALNLADPFPFLAYNTAFDQTQGCAPTASYVSNRIAVLASCGMPAGFVIQLDDGWMNPNPRAAGQAIKWNTNNFPNGIAPLAAYAHSFGFRFLIYTSMGTTTCCGFPASGGFEDLDMTEFASWGVDWVKVDGCGGVSTDPNTLESKAILWDSAIQNAGYPIGLEMSISGFGGGQDNLDYASMINDTDYGAQQAIVNTSTFTNLLTALDEAMNPAGILGYRQQIGPGHFSDAMIVAVNTNLPTACLTNTTRQAMAICALLASPVQFDGPASPANLAYMLNGDVVGILRDPLVIRCSILSSNAGLEVLSKPLQNGSVAIGFVNRSATPNAPMTVNWPALGFPSGAVCAVHNPWSGADIAFATNAYTAIVPANDISVLIFRPQPLSLSLQNLTLSGATNQLIFGAAGTPPANTNPVTWVSVQISGDTNQYRIPLMK